jgi:ribosomal protein L11 methyltransferase
MHVLVANALSFLAMVMAAEAFDAGIDLGVRSPVRLTLTHAQRELLESSLQSPAPSLLFDPDVADVQFHEAWSKDQRSFPLGDRFLVVPHSAPVHDEFDRVVIRLSEDDDARGIFGTGLHETTRIAARLLETWIGPARNVADIGTGSGILAIAALKLCADTVLALDIEQAAVIRARQNLAINGLAGRVILAARELDPAVDGPFDLVVANIFPNVLIRLAPALAAVVAGGGILIVSGVVDNRLADVVQSLELAGFRELERRSRGNWSGAALRLEHQVRHAGKR